ncbi:hypothetical protein XPA_001640 [Xanthoria parietina]
MKRSRTGCLTCRGRKLKCDERKPACDQCTKARRECRPCDGVVFRHQQNASMNSGQEDRGNLDGFYAYKDTFDPDNVWVDVPKAVTFVPVLDPYAISSSPELEATGHAQDIHEPESRRAEIYPSDTSNDASTKELEGLIPAALYLPSEDNMLHQPNPSYPGNSFIDLAQHRVDEEATPVEVLPQSQTIFAPATGDLGFILNPSASLSPGVPPTDIFHRVLEHVPVAQVSNCSNETRKAQFKAGTETSHRTAFLLRHFSEVTGRWMDLFDQTTFFGSHIPVKSISNPLLKHSACAYAAKQLGRVNGAKAIVGGRSSRQASMEQWDKLDPEEWALLAAQHYDQAISLLLEALHWDQDSSEVDNSASIDERYYAPRTLDGMVNERKLRRRKFGSAQSTARSDDVLAATAILCEYESLDASTAAWTRHLSGTKTLLDVVEVGVMPLNTTISPEAFSIPSPRTKPSQARKAIFWNFARQDLFAAFMHECRTRLDTDDVSMWKDAGLLLDEHDLVVPSNTADVDLPEEDFMREDMSGNALIWLVSKMMNLICASSDPNSSPGNNNNNNPNPTSAGPNPNLQDDLLSQSWHHLIHQMQTWFNGLPETFMPSAIIPVVRPDGASSNLTEVWLSIPVCTATTLLWHFSQILLLVHRPPHIIPPHRPRHRRRAATAIADRITAYRTLQSEILYHSRQILGLCLARPDAAVRIFALHPLFVAGQCLTEVGERRVVVELLRGVERDLGWATGYRVRQLREQWGEGGGEGEGG